MKSIKSLINVYINEHLALSVPVGVVEADKFQLWKQLKRAPAVWAILTDVCVCACVGRLKGIFSFLEGPKVANTV